MSRIKSANAGTIEYFFKTNKEGYGKWYAPAALNLPEEVTEKDFRSLLNGFHQETGAKLTQNAGKPTETIDEKKGRDWGWCWQLDAPKDVSVEWAATKESNPERHKALEREFEASVEKTVRAYMAQYFQTRAGKGGPKFEECTPVVAVFYHYASRPVSNGVPGDPQLHAHIVVCNVGQTTSDKKFRALYSVPFFQAQEDIAAYHKTELALSLQKMGYEVKARPDRNSFELPSVPRELVSEFSKRSEVIAEAIAAKGEEKLTPEDKERVVITTALRKFVVRNLDIIQDHLQEQEKLEREEAKEQKALTEYREMIDRYDITKEVCLRAWEKTCAQFRYRGWLGKKEEITLWDARYTEAFPRYREDSVFVLNSKMKAMLFEHATGFKAVSNNEWHYHETYLKKKEKFRADYEKKYGREYVESAATSPLRNAWDYATWRITKQQQEARNAHWRLEQVHEKIEQGDYIYHEHELPHFVKKLLKEESQSYEHRLRMKY